VLVYRRFAPEARQLGAGIAEQTRQLTSEPESVSDGAVQQRYGARRAAVAAMIVDLQRLVTAESALTADSGYPRFLLPAHSPHYWTGPSRGNVGPMITITPNGWWATMSNTLTGIHCAVAVGGDTTFGTAKSGEPWCFGEKDMTGAQ
jgi:hypothetical protein